MTRNLGENWEFILSQFLSNPNSAIENNSHTAAARKLGLDAEALGEVLAIIGLFNTTNALAHGYQVKSDVLPPLD